MKKKLSTALIISGLGLILALGVGKMLQQRPASAPQVQGPSFPPSGGAASSGTPGAPTPKIPMASKKRIPAFPPFPSSPPFPAPGTHSQVASPSDLEKSRQEFAERFGADLELKWNSEGQLISVHGVPGQGTPAAPDFTPQDPQKVTLRGQEIVRAAQELLGLRSELPLSNPILREGPVTAQLYFRETYHGLNFMPEGNLKIDLGPKGEILGLDSDYLSKITIVPDVKLTSGEALAKAQSASISGTSGVSSAAPVLGGNQVVWVTQAQGHVAYQFFIHGREVVIDAGTGEVLLSRNRKQE